MDLAQTACARAPEGIWLHMIRRTLTLNRILDGIGAGDRGISYKAGIDCGHNELVLDDSTKTFLSSPVEVL